MLQNGLIQVFTGKVKMYVAENVLSEHTFYKPCIRKESITNQAIYHHLVIAMATF